MPDDVLLSLVEDSLTEERELLGGGVIELSEEDGKGSSLDPLEVSGELDDELLTPGELDELELDEERLLELNFIEESLELKSEDEVDDSLLPFGMVHSLDC